MRKHRLHRHPSPHNMPESLSQPTSRQPLHNTQPFLNHETLTQNQQAKFLGVDQETVLNLGHRCSVNDIMHNPVGTPVEYSGGPAKRSLHESDRAGHGVYGGFADPKSGLSTDPASMRDWQGFASANSRITRARDSMEPHDPHPDPRPNQPKLRHASGKHE